MPALLAPWLIFSTLLAPLAYAHSEGHQHAPSVHQHGHAQIDLLLEANQLHLDFTSPAANLLGFEHAPRTEAQQLQLAQLHRQLTQAQLLALPDNAQCKLHSEQLNNPLSQDPAHQAHADIQLQQQWHCAHPQAFTALDFSPLFEAFAGIEQLHLQLIAPHGQQGAQLTPQQPRLELKHE